MFTIPDSGEKDQDVFKILTCHIITFQLFEKIE